MSSISARMPPPSYSRRQSLLDDETASICSAAPSYLSASPSYLSDSPSYATLDPTSPFCSRRNDALSLTAYSRSSWSIPNHSSRHYQSIAQGRANAASARDRRDLLAAAMTTQDPVKALQKVVEEREKEEFGDERKGVEGKRVRPLEDPELVGVEAAERARKERLKKEGDEVLVREDKRWDWMLSQMDDWAEREKSWKKFRSEVQRTRMEKMAHKLGFRLGVNRAR